MKPAIVQSIVVLIFDLVIPGYAGYRAFLEYPDGAWILMATIAGASISISFILIYVFSKQQKKAQQKDPIHQKIKSYRESGQDLHINLEDALTDEDVSMLNRHNSQSLILATVVLVILGLAFLIFSEEIFARLLGVVLLVVIFPIRKHLQKEIVRVIAEGKKQVIRGIVTERYTTTTGTGDSRTTDFWLTLGEVKFQVTRSQYDHYQIGDAAEFHTVDYPKGSTLIVRDEKLIKAGLT